MIRVMLVDDDALFRAQLRSSEDWEAEGIRFVLEARNGREGILMLSDDLPDVIVTDVSMPVMGGVDFIEFLHKYHPAIPVIALSGYDDFDFVRDCLTGGAYDYLLKSQIGDGHLARVIRKAASALPARKDSPGRYKEEESFYFLLLSGWFSSPEEMESYAAESGVRWPKNGVWPVALAVENGQAPSNHMLTMLEELLGPALHTVVRTTPITLLLRRDDALWNATPFLEPLRLMIDNFARFFNVSASCGVGNLCPSPKELPAGFHQAVRRLEISRFSGQTGFVAWEDLRTESGQPILSTEKERLLTALLHGAQEDALDREVHGLFVGLAGRTPATVSLLYAALMHLLLRIAQDNGLPAEDALPGASSFASLGEMADFCAHRFQQLSRSLLRRQGDPNERYVQTVEEFLQAHYSERLTLSGIAATVSLNPSYLCRIFKNATGESPISRLNRIRLHEAERLLRTTALPIKQVAAQVGIGSYNHFFTMFRESRGVSPAEYRKKPDKDR